MAGLHINKRRNESTIATMLGVIDTNVRRYGKIDPKKLKPITFDPVNNTYIGLGEVIGKAFVDGLQLK